MGDERLKLAPKQKQQMGMFRPGVNSMLNACVGRNGGPYNYCNYADGYFEAAKRLIESLRENSHWVDCVVYPVAFTFRHAVELSLKHLNQKLPRLWGEQAPTKWTHRLTDNWATVRSYLCRDLDCFDVSGELMPFVDELVSEFVAIDPNGEVFRFPRGKTGAWFLQDQSIINLDVLDDSLRRAQEVFDWWDFTAGRLWDSQCESAQ